jgi:hypothetical protein
VTVLTPFVETGFEVGSGGGVSASAKEGVEIRRMSAGLRRLSRCERADMMKVELRIFLGEIRV